MLKFASSSRSLASPRAAAAETAAASFPSSQKLSKLIENFESNLPETKLESMGVGLMRGMFCSMWILGLLSTVAMIMLGAVYSTVDMYEFGEDITVSSSSPLKRGVYVIEGLFRTVGSIGVLFLLVTFPQRTIRSAWEEHKKQQQHSNKPQPHQILLIGQIILLVLSPMVFVFGTVLFWGDFQVLVEDYNLSTADNVSINLERDDDVNGSVQFTLPSLMSLMQEQSGAWRYSNVTLSLCLISLYIFPIAWFKLQQVVKLVPGTNANNNVSSHATLPRADTQDMENMALRVNEEEDEEEAVADATQNEAAFAEMCVRTKLLLMSMWKLARVRCTEWDFAIVILMYLIVLLILAFGLNVTMSIVPLVHMITLLRFCIESDVNDFVPTNVTVTQTNSVIMEDVTVTGNFTFQLIVHSLDISTKHAICSPDQVDSILFLRVICLSFACFFELWLMFYIYRISMQTKMFLTGQNYFVYRKEILEYQFFRALYKLVTFFVLLIGVLAASLNPLDVFYLEEIKVNMQANDDDLFLRVEVFLNPLFQVGVAFGTVGYGGVFCMMAAFLGWICFTSLPVDSFGIRGWFCGGRNTSRNNKDGKNADNQNDYLALVPEESTVSELLELNQYSNLPPTLRTGLMAAFANADKSHSRTKLQNQIAGNFFCLETEILLFHFMHLSYVLANTKRVSVNGTVGEKQRLSFTEQQKFVEDSRFTLEEHIIDIGSDTHVFIFAAEDRIVVAFRGSVSMTNWRTDFDFAEVECPFATQVTTPDITLLGEGNMVRAKKVAEGTKPVVHRGFVLAYETVRKRVIDRVRGLRLDGKRTAVFVTGHSLGGGLGILCALDLALTLQLAKDSITLTTWGAPKIGNFSFVTRFHHMCPSARRFAMVDDVITKLPPKKFLSTLTLSGWWHVGTEILLNSNGQCLIRPTDLERFMFQSTLGNASAHLRMNYATAIMIWIARSQPEFKGDWWVSVLTLFNKTRDRRLKKLPATLRQLLSESLEKPGVLYRLDQRMVRDMVATTEQEEEEVGEMITELLVAYRTRNAQEFDAVFARIQHLKDTRTLFQSDLATV